MKQVVALWIAYALLVTAAVLGNRRAAAPPPQHALALACAMAAGSSALAMLAPFVLAESPARTAVALWGLAGFAMAVLAVAFVRRHKALARLLQSQHHVGWSGGQTLAPAPRSEGFSYRSFGLVIIPLLVIQLYVCTPPIMGWFLGSIGATAFLLVAPPLLAHGIVLGVVSRACYFALFSAPSGD